MGRTIIVEGNIGSGKSTFLKEMEHIIENVTIVQEPVDDWFLIKDENDKSLFENFYQEPSKYSFMLQMNILSSRYTTMKSSLHLSNNDICLFERSIFTDKHVFVPTLCDLNQMNKMELEVFTNMYHCMQTSTPMIDGIIYLKCSPEISYERVIKRNRPGESGITLPYLQMLHSKHEEWLYLTYNEVPIHVIDVSDNYIDYNSSSIIQFIHHIK